jgi:hypothetical protein
MPFGNFCGLATIFPSSSARYLPAIVDYDVLVARVFHAAFHPGIGGFFD